MYLWLFIVHRFNCHKFIVVLKFLFFSLDHSAKDGNWCQRADFFLEETLTWIENKCSDLMLSDWLWSFVYWWVHNLNMAANGRSPRAQSCASMYIHNKRWTGQNMAVYNFSWKRGSIEDLEIIVPSLSLATFPRWWISTFEKIDSWNQICLLKWHISPGSCSQQLGKWVCNMVGVTNLNAIFLKYPQSNTKKNNSG